MTKHIDQLELWWKLAEDGIPKAGDTIIADERHRGHGFYVYQATKDHPHGYDNIRILHRAPAPTPAWHDAVAVIATASGHRRALIRRDEDEWTDGGWSWANDQLTDVTPLIEQKVTDEAATRVLEYLDGFGIHKGQVIGREIVAAALGLDPA